MWLKKTRGTDETNDRDEVFSAAQFIKGTKIVSEKAIQVRE